MKISRILLIVLLAEFVGHSITYGQFSISDEIVISVPIQPDVVAISPDGSMVICGGNSKRLFIYDTKTGENISTIFLYEVFKVYDIEFSPDGKMFAAVGDDIIAIFSSTSFAEIFSSKCPGNIYSIAFSPDNKKITAVFNRTARIWELQEFHFQDFNIGQSKYIKVRWSPSDNVLLLLDNSNKLSLFNFADHRFIAKDVSMDDEISDITFARNGNLIFACSAIKSITILNKNTLKNQNVLALPNHEPWFVLQGIIPDSFLSGGEDGSLFYWIPPIYEHFKLIEDSKSRLLSGDINHSNSIIVAGFSNKSIHTFKLNFFYSFIIKEAVTKKIDIWQKQGKYEKTSEFLARVNELSRLQQTELFTQSVIDSLALSKRDWTIENTEYDADNETFKFKFKHFGPIFIKASVTEAEMLDNSIKQLDFQNARFTLSNDEFVLIHLTIEDAINHKVYTYDRQDVKIFNSEKLEIKFNPIEMPVMHSSNINDGVILANSTTNLQPGSDVDQNLPTVKCNGNESYVLIIGNEDYTKFNSNLSPEANVPFARNDARSFYNYANKVLCIPEENIFLFTDAISSVMKREIEKIVKIVNYGEGNHDILFYFAGHGLPDEETKASYILPVDISSENLRDGIKLSDLYAKFSNSKARRIIAFIDACFSGEGRNQSLLAARAVKIRPLENIPTGNILILTAVESDQRSLPYNKQQHGIFTYSLLKFLKETEGKGSLATLNEYLKKEVPVLSIKLFGIEQVPHLSTGYGVDPNWPDWTLQGK